MIENDAEQKRPVFLTVLCVLTFVSSFMGGLSAFFTPLFRDLFLEVAKSSPFIQENDKQTLIMIVSAGMPYHLSLLLFYSGSMIGAIYMWQLKKIGFHIYAVSNLAILFIPTLFLGILVGVSSVLVTLSFIGLYGVYLKIMR